MDFKEKLRQATLEAEKSQVESLPSDEEIFWTPSRSFNEKMEKTISKIGPVMPKRAKPLWRIYAATAAAVAVIGLAFSPLIQKSSDFIGIKEDSSNSIYDDEQLNNNSSQNDSAHSNEEFNSGTSEDSGTDRDCTEEVPENPSDAYNESDSTVEPDNTSSDYEDEDLKFRDLAATDEDWQVMDSSAAEILTDYINNGNWMDGRTKEHNAGYAIKYKGKIYSYWAPAGILIDDEKEMYLYLPSGGNNHFVINGALGYYGPVDEGAESGAKVLIKGNSPSSTYIPSVYVPLTEEEEDRLYNAIINGKWVDENCDCYSEFLFEVIMPDGKKAVMRYTYLEGVVNDDANQKRMAFDEETRRWLDGILHQYIVFE